MEKIKWLLIKNLHFDAALNVGFVSNNASLKFYYPQSLHPSLTQVT